MSHVTPGETGGLGAWMEATPSIWVGLEAPAVNHPWKNRRR